MSEHPQHQTGFILRNNDRMGPQQGSPNGVYIRISYKKHENFGEQSNGGKKLRRDEKNNKRSNSHQEKGELNEMLLFGWGWVGTRPWLGGGGERVRG
jgi:hypothetical protein